MCLGPYDRGAVRLYAQVVQRLNDGILDGRVIGAFKGAVLTKISRSD